MPYFFPRRRRKSLTSFTSHKSPLQLEASHQSSSLSLPSSAPPPLLDKSFAERKIHPNLNALADDMTRSSATRGNTTDLSFQQIYAHNMVSVPRRTLFQGPRKSPSGRIGLSGEVVEDDALAAPVPQPGSQDTTRQDSPTISNPSPPYVTTKVNGEWPTFGKSNISPGLISLEAQTTSSPFSQRRFCPLDTPTSPSESSTQPHTPVSNRKSNTSHSHSSTSQKPSRSNSSISPHTFGARTPPVSISSKQFKHDSTPPPLPPLNHPAFRTGPLFTSIPRHSHSLPSFRRTQPKLKEHKLRSGRIGRKRARTSSRSRLQAQPEIQAVGILAQFESSLPKSESTKHGRSRSKSSVTSSRRSSAEYSSKKASSVGHGSEYEKSWEVQVAEEMVRISLGEPSTYGPSNPNIHPSSFGRMQARGHNQSTCDNIGLGSAFLYQDTLYHYLQSNLSKEGISSPHLQNKSSRSTSIKSAESMATNDTSRNNKGKDKESSIPIPSHDTTNRATEVGQTRAPSPTPKIQTSSYFGTNQATSSLLSPPSLSVTAPTPQPSPTSPMRRVHHKSHPAEPPSSVLRYPSSPPIQKSHSSSSTGKRKADEAGVADGGTPPKEHKEQRATFALDPRPHRVSANSSTHAPSSYHRKKRARLSATPESRSDSPEEPLNAKNTGSLASRASSRRALSSHEASRAPSTSNYPHHSSSRRSFSQNSMPISALVSPHAPSVGRSAIFHMRDPRKPAPIQSTPWTLNFPSRAEKGDESGSLSWTQRGGSPLHAWIFFIGFVVFPAWWIAALFIGIPKTRQLGGNEAEKGVILDDPQLEHDSKSWRFRCRIMAVVSLFTYVPFIILVAIFAR